MSQIKQIRNTWIEVAKTIAIFGVVLVHMGPDQPDAVTVTNFFAVYSVPFFLTLSLYFFWRNILANSYQENSIRDWMRFIRFDRLVLPYLSWTAIYLAARFMKHKMNGSDFDVDWINVLFFGGSAVQLYFIPLLIFFQIIGGAIYFLVKAYERKKVPLISIGVLIAFICLGELTRYSGFLGFSNGFFEKSLAYLSVSFILILMERWRVDGWNRVNLALGLLGGLYFIFFNLTGLGYKFGIFYLPIVTFLLAIFLLGLPGLRMPSYINVVLQASFGVYLMHHLIIEGVEVVFLRFGIALAPYSLADKLICGSLVMMVSVLFVLAIRRIPWFGRSLLGE